MTTLPLPAGLANDYKQGGVASCLRTEDRPNTPPAISKWRQYGSALPGQRALHPGYIDDAKKIESNITFGGNGVKSSDHVPDVWQQVRTCKS